MCFHEDAAAPDVFYDLHILAKWSISLSFKSGLEDNLLSKYGNLSNLVKSRSEDCQRREGWTEILQTLELPPICFYPWEVSWNNLINPLTDKNHLR